MTMTTQPSAIVDSENGTIRRTIVIGAPVESVWAAITEVEHIKKWFGTDATLDEVAVGAGGVFTFDGFDGFPVVIEELEPQRVIAYRWSNDNGRSPESRRVDPEHSTVFRFTLEELDGGTRLTVVESGFGTLSDPAGALAANRAGWDVELDELAAYLEGTS
jgi:Uncharacterized conserved protein